MQESSDSSCDASDGELKRLQEALCGASLPLPSKRRESNPRKDENTTTSQLSVTEDMQKHLAKRLGKYLDSRYDFVNPPCPPGSGGDVDCSSTSSVRLFRGSAHPLVVTPKGASVDPSSTLPSGNSKRKRKRRKSSNQSSESEDEEKKQRIQQAAIDPAIILKHTQTEKRTKKKRKESVETNQ